MYYHITKCELEILTVLWEVGRPLSRGELLGYSTDKTWKDNSIHILLNGMLKKELIKEEGFIRSGKVWGRLYAPTFTVEEYYRDMLRSGPRLDPARFLELLVVENPDQETVRSLREIIERAR